MKDIKQFIKENQTIIDSITEINPTISKDDEWRENNEWNNYWDKINDFVYGWIYKGCELKTLTNDKNEVTSISIELVDR